MEVDLRQNKRLESPYSMEINPEQQKLLQEGHQEAYDYVLIFTNPYDPTLFPKTGKKQVDATLDSEEAKNVFCRVFKSSEADITAERPWFPLLKELWGGLVGFLQGKPNVTFHEFAEYLMKCIIRVMQEELKLDLYLFFSRDKDEIFCKIRSTEENLKIQADLTDYQLQLVHYDSETLPHQAVPPYGPYEVGQKKSLLLKQVDKEHYFQRYDSFDQLVTEGGSIFMYKDRVRLIVSMLDSKFERSVLAQGGFLVSEMCVNNEAIRANFQKDWTTLWHFWRKQDISRVRSYFGEEVAMYFAWIEFYIGWLVVPGLVGVVAFLVVVGTDGHVYSKEGHGNSNYALLGFAMFLSICSTLFDVLWTRKESVLAWRWGTSNLQASEGQRSEFEGPWEKDTVTGKMRKSREPGGWPRARKLFSISVVFTFVMMVIAVLVAIFWVRINYKNRVAGIVQWTAFVNAIQIKIMAFIYSYVAKWLTDWENIEFQTAYYDALSVKLFMFQFVNSYASLFYIAFVKSGTEGCANNNCMEELTTQLYIIFLTNLALNAFELGLPTLMMWMRNRKDLKKYQNLKAMAQDKVRASDTLSPVEKQSKWSKYETPLNDYMEIVLQYGYVVMFCPVFPLAPLLALCLSVLEIRVDAWKLCNLEQRPFPDPVKDIGVWSTIMRLLSTFAAITNPAIVIFTAKTFDDYSTNTYWIIFLALEHFLLGFQIVMRSFVASTPTPVRLGLQWSERVMEERLMGRDSDVDKEREKRDLRFRADESQKKVEFNSSTIELDNI